MRQVLARRTVVLHLRNMFNAFIGAEAQDKESTRNIVISVLHREKRIIREVQSMDGPKSSTSTSKRMSQRDTRRRNSIRLLRTDGTETNYPANLKTPSDGPKNIVNTRIRSCQLIGFTHTQLQGRKERETFEKNLTLGVNGQGP